MKIALVLHITLLLSIPSLVSAKAEPEIDANAVLAKARSWEKGQPIPVELLEYRDSRSCFHLHSDTVPLFNDIDNYTLLIEIVFYSKSGKEIFDIAKERALYLVGPNRFFKDLASALANNPELLKIDRYKMLNDQLKNRHVVVDGLFINAERAKTRDGRQLLDSIRIDLKSGIAWGNVYRKYWKLAKVGNYGDFVISKDKRDAYPFRRAEMPEEHAQKLLNSKTKEILILPDEAKKRLILYQVREVYEGP